MSNQENQEDNPEIKEVLKALNHSKRRDILLYLKDLKRETSFTELMEFLDIDSKTSSQFSYHLKLLITAKLITKAYKSEKYVISPLGLKACSMLDMVDTTEHNESIVQKISLSYKNITPFDQIIIALQSFGMALFLMPITGIFRYSNLFLQLFLFMLFGLLIFLSVAFYSYAKLKYIPSLLVLTNLVWIIFLPENQIKCGIIYMASVLGGVYFYQVIISILLDEGDLLLSLFFSFVFLGLTIIIAIYILYNEYFKDVKAQLVI